MCVNTVRVLNNKRKRQKKNSRPFSSFIFQFLTPPPFPLPSLSLLPNRPLLLHPPRVSWDPSLLLPWQHLNHLTVVPDTAPHLLLLVCSCLPALFSAASPLPPTHPNSLLLSPKTWLPDKKKKKSPNHSGKWGIWWWDDPPRFFSSLPKPLKWLQQS